MAENGQLTHNEVALNVTPAIGVPVLQPSPQAQAISAGISQDTTDNYFARSETHVL